jgi:hypothetical protein
MLRDAIKSTVLSVVRLNVILLTAVAPYDQVHFFKIKMKFYIFCARCLKTFYGRNLRTLLIS